MNIIDFSNSAEYSFTIALQLTQLAYLPLQQSNLPLPMPLS